MSILSDFFLARAIWRVLTKAQREALLHPWADPHPTVEANLRKRELWSDDGPTRSGLAIALIEYQLRSGDAARHSKAIARKIADEITTQGRAEVERLAAQSTDSIDRARHIGAEDAYKHAIQIAKDAS